MYSLTPIEASKAKNLGLRTLHTLNVRSQIFPRISGQQKVKETRLLRHIKTQIQWLNMLTTDELYNIKQEINNIAPIFHKYVDFFYQLRAGTIWGQELENLSESLIHTGSLTDIYLKDETDKLTIFEYVNKTSLSNPGVPAPEKPKRAVAPHGFANINRNILDKIEKQIGAIEVTTGVDPVPNITTGE